MEPKIEFFAYAHEICPHTKPPEFTMLRVFSC